MEQINTNAKNQSYSVMTLVLFWCGLVVLSSMYITIPLISVFSTTFQVTLKQAAWVGSIFSLFYALGCLFFGAISDKYGRKVFLIIGICSITLVTIFIGFIKSFFGLLVLRAIQGAVASVYAPISLVYVGEIFPVHKRMTTIGFITSGFLMAAIFGQVMSSAIHEFLGWEYVFFILASLYLVSTFLVVKILPKDERKVHTETVLDNFRTMALLLKNNQLLLTLSITFITLLSLVAMYTVLGSYLSSSTYHFSSQEILWVRAFGIVGILLAPFAGRFAAKYGASDILRIGLVFATVGVTMMGVFTNIIIIVSMSVLFVAGIALVCPVTISMVSVLGKEVRGTAVTFNAFILFVGASVGPVLAVYLMDVVRDEISFMVLGIILFIGLLVSMFIQVEHKT